MHLAPVRPLIGRAEQLAAAAPAVLTDGAARGVRVIDVHTYGGLAATVLVDRGFDLGQVWCGSVPLAWISQVGITRPSDTADDTWLRRFGGGLLTTCGLVNVGPASEYAGERYGLHGRISNLPAADVRTDLVDDPGGAYLSVSGQVREASVYGPELELKREYRFHVGTATLDIHDTVTNTGARPAPLQTLYHFNLGYPLISENSVITSCPVRSTAIQDTPHSLVASCWQLRAPDADAEVHVFLHEPEVVAERAWVVVANADAPHGGVGVRISWPTGGLPRFAQWRMAAPGTYVLGIEPTNTRLRGVAAEAADGSALVLPPGERASFDLCIEAAVAVPGTAPFTASG